MVSPLDPLAKSYRPREQPSHPGEASLSTAKLSVLNSSLQAHNTPCGCQVEASHTNWRKGTVAHCKNRRLVLVVVLQWNARYCQAWGPNLSVYPRNVIWRSANMATPSKREDCFHISVCKNLDKYLVFLKETLLHRKKNIFYEKLQLCSIVFKKQIHCLNKKEITWVNTNKFYLSVEHFANRFLDQMGTEGFEKLLKENLTIKTLSLAEQHLKISGLFSNYI